MKISVFSALYPPQVIGGAELVAHALNTQLARRGHEVHVLTTGAETHQAASETRDGVQIKRIRLHRPYQPYDYANHSPLEKLAWHFLDHASPENVSAWANFLDETQPDAVMVQVTQGLGFNGLKALAGRDLPCFYVIHDLSLACVKTTMFRGGAACSGQCAPCRVSRALKAPALAAIKNLTVISPSQAIYDRLSEYVDLSAHPHVVLRNPVSYAAPDHVPGSADRLRLLYAGQVSISKGVDFLLATFARLKAGGSQASLTVVGGGPDLEHLQDAYGSTSDLVFTGKVSMDEVSQAMARHDALCVPSLWFENSPGVIAQALVCGLPVLASRIGGIPELIDDDLHGRLLAPGDTEAWLDALNDIEAEPERLKTWRDNNQRRAHAFDAGPLVDAYESLLMNSVRKT